MYVCIHIYTLKHRECVRDRQKEKEREREIGREEGREGTERTDGGRERETGGRKRHGGREEGVCVGGREGEYLQGVWSTPKETYYRSKRDLLLLEYLQGVWSTPKESREWQRMKGIPPSSSSIIRCS